MPDARASASARASSVAYGSVVSAFAGPPLSVSMTVAPL